MSKESPYIYLIIYWRMFGDKMIRNKRLFKRASRHTDRKDAEILGWKAK